MINPPQVRPEEPTEESLIGICSGFSGIAYYRKRGSRGPLGRAWIDLARVTAAEHKATLEARLGPIEQFAVEIMRQPEPEASPEISAPPQPVSIVRPPPCRHDGELPAEVRDYAGGVMPLAVITWSRERRRAAGLSQ